MQHFDYRQITEIIDIMLNAKSITIFTTSSNLSFPGNFAFQMKEIGYPVNVPKDEYNQSLYAASANQDDVAIIISYQGRSKILHHVADTLHAQDIKTILITSVHDPEIKNKVKYCLYLASNENHYNKISSFLLGFHSCTS